MKLLKPLLFSIFGFALVSSLNANESQKQKVYGASERAIALAQNSIIVDGHIDVPHRVYASWVDVTQATEGGDFDYPRA